MQLIRSASAMWMNIREAARRYEPGTRSGKEGFPLDGVNCEVCTWSYMARSNNTDAKVKKPGAIVRLFERSHVGWRKVATGAAALLALAMGYHVVFGQNGLTAYQQKRQDTQSLDRQMRSLQKENEQLKGHVERLKTTRMRSSIRLVRSCTTPVRAK